VLRNFAIWGCLVSVGLSSSFVASVARADDCSDGLMAESCACMSSAPSEPKQVRSRAKNSLSKQRSRTPEGSESHFALQVKSTKGRSDHVLPEK
jgi:hypothetical protein